MTAPATLPLPDRVVTEYPGDEALTDLAGTLDMIYSGTYKMNSFEALLCLKVTAGAMLSQLSPANYPRGVDELAAIRALTDRLSR